MSETTVKPLSSHLERPSCGRCSSKIISQDPINFTDRDNTRIGQDRAKVSLSARFRDLIGWIGEVGSCVIESGGTSTPIVGGMGDGESERTWADAVDVWDGLWLESWGMVEELKRRMAVVME